VNEKKTFPCPFCHAEVPQGASACPECGSDEQTGWSDDLYGLRSEETKEKRNPLTAIIAVGLAALLIIPFLAALLFNRNGIFLLPALVILLALIIFLGRHYSKKKDASGGEIYQELLLKARGDDALVERLLEYEKQKNPFRTKRRLLADALERWEKDSR
jgi:hypothetical protein